MRAAAAAVFASRPVVHENDVGAQLGGAEWLGAEPLGRPAKRGHVQPLDTVI